MTRLHFTPGTMQIQLGAEVMELQPIEAEPTIELAPPSGVWRASGAGELTPAARLQFFAMFEAGRRMLGYSLLRNSPTRESL